MAVSVAIPKLGVEMTSAKISEWSANTGDKVEKGQVIAVIETDKLTNEIESPAEGYMKQIGELGIEYDIGVVIAEITEAPEAAGTVPAASAVTSESAAEVSADAPVAHQTEAHAEEENIGWIKATPLARAMAKARNINLAHVKGTGYGGAVTRKDVEAYKEEPKVENAPETVQPVAEAQVVQSQPMVDNPLKKVREVRPFSTTRESIAKHMMQSLATTAQMTDIRHFEVSDFMAFRNSLAAKEEQLGFKVSYFDLIILATINTLKKYPEYNATVDGNSLVIWDNINIGIAVASDQGLIVPVLHDADRMSLSEIHYKSQELINKARDHKLSPDDISGGTFTISNYGSFGSEGGTPIINMPQVAILGVGAFTPTPVVKEGQVVAGNVMCSCLTQDHRVLDGENSAKFQNLLKKYMENPELILIG